MNKTLRRFFLGGAFLAALAIPCASFAARVPASFFVSAAALRQGETIVLEVVPTASGTVKSVAGWVGSRRVRFLPSSSKFVGLYGAPAKAIPGTYRARILVNNWYATSTFVTISDAKFPTTELVVTPELKAQGFTPKKIASNIAVKDTPALAQAIARPTLTPLFESAFQYPLDVVRDVGAFGNYRKEGGVKLQHLGVDLEAAAGTPVYAINDGVVTMAKRLINYGNTIVIDHGATTFSFSLHLDRFAVVKGDRVTKGQVIGYSGNTGYSIAPHLHLSVVLNGTNVDPLAFIVATQSAMQ